MALPRRPALEPVPFRDRLTLWIRGLNRRRLVALVATVVVVVVVQGVVGRARTTVAQLGTRVDVVVIARAVPAGTTLRADDLLSQQWPVAVVPDAELVADPVGRVALVDLIRGDPVVEDRLFPSSGWLRPNQRQVTIPTPIASPPVELGDDVDLIGLLPPDGPFTSTPSLVATGTVVAIDETGISVAIPEHDVLPVVEFLVLGVIEIVVLP